MRIEDCYEFGYITRTHGVRGELVLTLDVDDSSAYQAIDSFFILVKGIWFHTSWMRYGCRKIKP